MANKSLQQLLQDFRKATKDMEALRAKLPRIIGAEATKVAKQNFQLQGYDNGFSVTPWAKRSPVTDLAYDRGRGRKLGAGSKAKNSYKGSVFGSHNPILEQTRNMYSNLQYFISGRNVLVGWDLNIVPYAKKMNDGGAGKWGRNNTWTPPRQVVPKDGERNQKMINAVMHKLNYEHDKVLKDFKK